MSNDAYLLGECSKMVAELNETHGTNAKIEVMAKYVHLQPLLKRIYDTHLKTGITAKSLDDFISKGKDPIMGEYGLGLYELFDKLVDRVLTGDKARASVWVFIKKHSAHTDIIKQIVSKDLRIRMGVKTIMQAFPGLYAEFGVMLAEEYDKDRFENIMKEHKDADPSCYISQKIDGVRLITLVHDGVPEFYSRTGKKYTSLDKLVSEFKALKGDWMIDGELVALDPDGRENFKLTVSVARKKDLQMDNPRYKVFDILPLDVWKASKPGGGKYSPRLDKLRQEFKEMKHIEVLPQIPWSPEVMSRLETEAKSKGWEGLMLRFNHEWEPKRSKYLQKYKFFSVEEFVIKGVGVENMPFPNETGGEDILPAVKHVMIEYKGGEVWVGSGFSKDERLKWAKTPELLKGQTIMVQFQEPFQDAKTKKWSLRCPVLIAFVGDKRDF